MLNPASNPLYIQVYYDGNQKTNIKTIPKHRNQIVHDDFTWDFSRDVQKNEDKVTSTKHS